MKQRYEARPCLRGMKLGLVREKKQNGAVGGSAISGKAWGVAGTPKFVREGEAVASLLWSKDGTDSDLHVEFVWRLASRNLKGKVKAGVASQAHQPCTSVRCTP